MKCHENQRIWIENESAMLLSYTSNDLVYANINKLSLIIINNILFLNYNPKIQIAALPL